MQFKNFEIILETVYDAYYTAYYKILMRNE